VASTFRYPRYDLASSIEVARTLQQHGGTASQHELATYLAYKSAKNGAFLTRLAAARIFGLVEGSPSTVGLTPRAHTILQPDYPSTEVRARLEAFLSVPLFRAFLERYEGQPLPPQSGMRNALQTQFQVPREQASLALNRMLTSAEQAGLFAAAGNRTKMIRPTTSSLSPTPGASSDSHPVLETRIETDRQTLPKLLEGALEELPDTAGGWSEQGLRDWLDLIEMALRVAYKVPRGPRGEA